jgi:hypothetical protein
MLLLYLAKRILREKNRLYDRNPHVYEILPLDFLMIIGNVGVTGKVPYLRIVATDSWIERFSFIR